jgi:hypothetical protein
MHIVENLARIDTQGSDCLEKLTAVSNNADAQVFGRQAG